MDLTVFELFSEWGLTASYRRREVQSGVRRDRARLALSAGGSVPMLAPAAFDNSAAARRGYGTRSSTGNGIGTAAP